MEADALDELVETISSNLSYSIGSSASTPLLLLPTMAPAQVEQTMLNRPFIKGAFLLIYVLVFFSCVIGNSMILIVIISNRSMRTVTNFFLANLAVADLLVGIFCVCQNAAHFVMFEHGTWPFGRVLCHAYVYILHMIPNSSAGILVLLSVERFIAVLRPMLVHHLMTKSVLLICAVLVWAFSALFNLPYLMAVQYLEMRNFETGGKQGICTRRFSDWNGINVLQVVSTVNLFLWYIIPLCMLLAIYASIGFVLLRSSNEDAVARSSQQNTNRNNLTSTNSCASGVSSSGVAMLNRTTSSGGGSNRRVSEAAPKIEVVDSRKRVIRLCVVIVLAFAFFSLPRYLYLTWSVWRDRNAPRCLDCVTALIQPTTFLLMFINSAINPILYAFLSQRFRCAIAETFTCPRKRKERHNRMVSLHRRRMSEQREREHILTSHSSSFRENSHGGGGGGANHYRRGSNIDSMVESTID